MEKEVTCGIFVIIMILLVGAVVLFAILFCMNSHKRAQMAIPPMEVRTGRFLTLTMTPDYVKELGGHATCGAQTEDNKVGLVHVRMCLQNLVILGRQSHRVAVCFPPWMYLSPHHNDGHYIGDDVEWDRYFDLSAYIERGDIAPLDYKVHMTSPHRGHVPTGKFIQPDTPVKKMKADSHPLLVMHCFHGWGKKGEEYGWNCAGEELGDGAGHGWQRDIPHLPFPPSASVKDHAKAAAKEIGDDFMMMHVRRGDVLTDPEGYWDVTMKNMNRITSSKFISQFLRRRRIPADKNIFVMTNEIDPHHFQELVRAYPNTKLETEVKYLVDLKAKYKDNFLVYEIVRYLSKLASLRIATCPCYFDEGCKYSLKEDSDSDDEDMTRML